LDRLDIELFERRLQFLIIHPRALVYLLDLSSRCALSSVFRLSAFLELAHFLPNPSMYPDSESWHRRIRKKRI
jgi:hypothetical protein